MQPGDQKFRPSVDRKHSTPEWDGITDPTKGPSMLTPSVDEEEVTPVEKIRKLIKQEIKRAPSKMTYAKRVLKKLLRACSSV